MELKEFMLIFIGVDYGEMKLSMDEIEKRAKSWMNWQQKMGESGVLKSGNALQSALLRISGNDRTVTDRISVEAKEIIGGYYIIVAKDFDDAAKVAEDYPDYDLGGTVEIRELIHYD